MATVLVANSILEASFVCVYQEQVSVNVVHFKVTAPAGGPTVDDVAIALDGEYNDDYKAWINGDAEYRGTSVRLLLLPVPEAPGVAVANAGNGSAGAALPPQLSGLVSFRTGRAGPKGRGRLYMPFPRSTLLDVDKVSGAGQIILQTFGNSLAGAEPFVVGGRSFTLQGCVYHRSGGTPVLDLFTTAQGRLQWATQRRRGHFGRANSLPAGF